MLGEEPISRFRNSAATRVSFAREGPHSIVSMLFHPHEMLLGVGATDAKLNVSHFPISSEPFQDILTIKALQVYRCQV